MFFVVSGYVYHPSTRTYYGEVGRRMKRILLPYFAYNALLFLYYLAKKIIGQDMELSNVITAVLGVLYSRNYLWTGRSENVYFFKLSNDPVWFLTAMCTASVIFYAIVDKCLKNKKQCGYIFAVLLAAAAAMSFFPILLPWSIDSAPLFALFMVTGALLGRAEFFEKKHTVVFWMFTAGATVLSVLLRLWNGKTNLSVRVYGEHGVFSLLCVAVIGIAGSVLLIWISKCLCRIGFLQKVLTYVGRNTLSIMALHMAIFQIIDAAAGKIFGNLFANGLLYWGYAGVKIMAAVVLSVAVSKIGKWVL
jgi:fucose 4-O-acetylase-like acetyltransferase